MEFMTVKEASVLWGISENDVRKLCRENKINGAVKQNNIWQIPADATCPNVKGDSKSSPDQVFENNSPANPVSQTSSTPEKSPIKKFTNFLLLLLAAVGLVIGGVALVFLGEFVAFLAGICFVGLGGILVVLMINALKTTHKEIKDTIVEETKLHGKSKTKKTAVWSSVGAISIVLFVGVIAASIYGSYAATFLNNRALELASETIDEDIFEKIEDFEEYYAKKDVLTHLFFTEKDTVANVKNEAEKLVSKRAAEIEKEISQLKPCKEIKSEAQYYELVNKINSLELSESNSFEKRVRKQVKNYTHLEIYKSDFEQLSETYKVTKRCNSCSGSGRFTCSRCNGSGKFLVTWYEHGDWGEKSYTASTCGACDGAGRKTCDRCNGKGTYSYYDFG